jgi:hypothetical protein
VLSPDGQVSCTCWEPWPNHSIGPLPPPEKCSSRVLATGVTLPSAAGWSVVSTGTHSAPRRTRTGVGAVRVVNVPSGCANVCASSVRSSSASTGTPYTWASHAASSAVAASVGGTSDCAAAAVAIGVALAAAGETAWIKPPTSKIEASAARRTRPPGMAVLDTCISPVKMHGHPA